jgi:hypothetical protein
MALISYKACPNPDCGKVPDTGKIFQCNSCGRKYCSRCGTRDLYYKKSYYCPEGHRDDKDPQVGQIS